MSFEAFVAMSQITLSIPDETLTALNLTQEEMGDEMRWAAAIKFYELGRLSSGAAAQFIGVPQPVFLSKLADFGVETFNLSEHELRGETRLA